MKKWKQLLATTLTVAMATTLTACGGGSGTNTGDNASSANAASSKEGVFDVQEYDIASLVGGDTDDYYISYPTVVNDRLWFQLTVYNYDDDAGTSQNEIYFVSMNTDGTDAQKIEPVFWQDGVNPYKLEEETAAAEDTAETTETTEGVGDVVDPDQEDGSYTYESQSIGNLTVTPDGQFVGIKAYYYETQDADGEYNSIDYQLVSCWNTDGSLAWDTEIEGLQTDESYSYVNMLATDADGSPILLISGDQSGIMQLGDDGALGEIRQSDAISSFIDNYSYIQDNHDGTLTVLYYDAENYTTQYIATYDIATDTLSEPTSVPSTISYAMQGSFTIDADGALWYGTSSGIYRYQNGEEAGEQVLNFINSDLDTDYFNSFAVIDEQHIIGFYYTDAESGYSVSTGGLLTYVAPEDIPDKATVTIGVYGADYELRQKVVAFNKESDTTRIAIRDYSEYNSYDDSTAWKTQLNNDILSGNMPDILDVSSLGSLDKYVSKGLFADVDELIANDPELADTEFLDNAFEAHRIDGKLYEVFPSFSVSTFGAKTALVGDKTSLTMDEAQQIVSSMGEDAKLISGVTRDYFFSTAMSYVGSEYVDVSAGTCNFDSDGFISLLEYAKTLQTEDEIYSDDGSEDNYTDFYGEDSQYRENKTLLCAIYLNGFANLNYYLNGYIGEDTSYVGFPNDGGCNGVINTSTSYALSAKSAVLDEAWDFISFYLKEEYQSTIEFGMPVTRKQFDTLAQKAMEKPYYVDENGNKVEYDETFWMNDEEIILPTLTQEQVDQAKAFVESVTTMTYYNDDVLNIINEEAEAFYSDQKSAQDVAKIIQSRVQVYVQENS